MAKHAMPDGTVANGKGSLRAPVSSGCEGLEHSRFPLSAGRFEKPSHVIYAFGAGLCIFFCCLAFLCCYQIDLGPCVGLTVVLAVLFGVYKKASSRYYPIALFVVSLTYYLLLVWIIQEPPVSDFLFQYEGARAFLHGDPQAFHTDYYLQYPWQIGWSILEASLLAAWDSMACIKAFNCVLTSGSLVLVYYMCLKLAGKRVAAAITTFAGVLPVFAIMPGVLNNQVPSAFFCLLSIYLLSFTEKGKAQPTWLKCIVAAFVFGLSYIIRPDTILIVVACAVALVVSSLRTCTQPMDIVVCASKGMLMVVIAWAMTAGFFSAVQAMGLAKTDNSSAIGYKIMLGTTFESNGGWYDGYEEDIETLAEKNNISKNEAALAIATENVSNPIEVASLIIAKNHVLWWGSPLTFALVDIRADYPGIVNWLYWVDKGAVALLLALCLVSYCSLAKARSQSQLYTLLAVCFLFTCLVYQVIEVQARYTYLCYYIIIPIAAHGAVIIMSWLQNRRRLTSANVDSWL